MNTVRSYSQSNWNGQLSSPCVSKSPERFSVHELEYITTSRVCPHMWRCDNMGRPGDLSNVDVFGRPFLKRFALCYHDRFLSVLSVCPVCDVGVLWPNGWMDQDETWHAGRPRSRPHCARWGPSSSRRRGTTPEFSAHVCCGQTAGWIKMPLATEVGLGSGGIVLDSDPAPPPLKGHNHQFSAHVRCGQKAG